MKTIDQRIKEIEVGLLKLQRSALIDTQSIMQLMLDKGLCTIEDITETRIRIESESPDVQRIDTQIASYGLNVDSDKNDEPDKMLAKDQLRALKSLLTQLPKDD